ncbi:MAG: glycosyltransferase family 2 protein [Chloroflexi bacterium]|nr:glycosyltransferase family 2 protein [Chloroflexota bacterium]
MGDLPVIIVNYNVREHLSNCLRSVLDSEGLRPSVTVVDNASSDGSVAMVRSQFPRVAVLASAVNGGFAYANNLGLRQVDRDHPAVDDPPYVLILNPDTQVAPHSLARLVGFLDGHPEAAVVGPKLVRADGSLDLACRRSFPTPAVSLYRLSGLSRFFPRSRRFARYNLTYLDPDQTAEVDSVAGACMLVRRAVIAAVGGFDERFFMYGEDLDWSLRMKAQGWKVYYYPGVVVRHLKGESSRRSAARATQAFYESMLLFYRKHYAAGTSPLLDRLIVSAIHLRGWWAGLRNRLLPEELRRVG